MEARITFRSSGKLFATLLLYSIKEFLSIVYSKKLNLILKGYQNLPQGKGDGLFLYPEKARTGASANEVMTVCG